MRIALAGYGGVGRAFHCLLHEKKPQLAAMGLELSLNYILEQQGGSYDEAGLSWPLSHDFCPKLRLETALARQDMDLLVLATPTNKQSGQPGLSYARAALSQGVGVVTADKGPILLDYAGLKQLATENRASLAMGCSCGGALPTLNGGLIELAGASILQIEGLLNGTSNFILEEMGWGGLDFGGALRRAQELGIAESDPTLDVEGFDTAIKLLILTNVLLGQEKTLADVSIRGISGLLPTDLRQAAEKGRKYKLLGRAQWQNGELKLTVAPQQLGPEHPFYYVDGKNKAVRYLTDSLGDLTISGGASGLKAAAASLLRDIVNIARGYRY